MKTLKNKVLAIGLAGTVASVGAVAGIAVAVQQPTDNKSLSAVDNARFSKNAFGQEITTAADFNHSSIWSYEQTGDVNNFLRYYKNSLDLTGEKLVDYAFSYNEMADDFWIPSTVTEIGRNAFEYANFNGGFKGQSSHFNLPWSITKIGAQAFFNTKLPSSFTLPSGLIQITFNAFEGTIFSEGFTIPSTVFNIEAEAFKNATLPTTFTIPKEVTGIGVRAFEGAKLPSGYVWTKDGKKVDGVSDGGHVYKIQNEKVLAMQEKYPWAFNGDMTEITKGAFKGKTVPVDFTIPSITTKIGEEAFSGTTLPAGFTIPSTVKTVGDSAFYGVSLPDGFTIPSTTQVATNAFVQSSIPTNSLWVEDGKKPFTSTLAGHEFKVMTNDDFLKLQFKQKVDEFNSKYPGALTEDGLAIAPRAFVNKVVPADFKFPDWVTKISSEAFSSATLPAGFTIPGTIKEVDSWAFYNVTLPRGFGIEATTKIMDDKVFAYAKLNAGDTWWQVNTNKAKGYGFPFGNQFRVENEKAMQMKAKYPWAFNSDMTEIANAAFKNKTVPTDFVFPSITTKIGSEAFSSATLPAGFTIPETVKNVGDWAFYNVRLPEGFTLSATTQAAEHTFSSATLQEGTVWTKDGQVSSEGTTLGHVYKVENKDTVTIRELKPTIDAFKVKYPGVLTEDGLAIADRAFVNKTVPTDFKIPSWVKSIGSEAFSSATLPAGFTIPETVKNVGDWAFYNVRLPEGFTLSATTQAAEHTFSSATLQEGTVWTQDGQPSSAGTSLGHVYKVENKITNYKINHPGILSEDGYSIENTAFKNKTVPSDFVFPSWVNKIGDQSFSGATLPAGFTIPLAIRNVGNWAFYNAHIPAGFTIPATTRIGSNTFENSSIDSENIWIQVNGTRNLLPTMLSVMREHVSYVVPTEPVSYGNEYKVMKRTDYATLKELQEFNSKYPGVLTEDGTKIANGAFMNKTVPNNFVIPSTVRVIGYQAFSSAKLPAGFTIPNTVQVIDDWAFYYVEIPEGFTVPATTQVATNAFNQSSTEKGTVWTKDGVWNYAGISLGHVYKVENEREVTFRREKAEMFAKYPDAFTTDGSEIKAGAFKNKTLPAGFTIPRWVKRIGNEAFSGATLPSGFTLTQELKSVGENAFYNVHLPVGFTIYAATAVPANAFTESKLAAGDIWAQNNFITIQKASGSVRQDNEYSVIHESDLAKIAAAYNAGKSLANGYELTVSATFLD